MSDMGESLDRFAEIETGEAFTPQNPRLLKIELSATSVMARNGAMVAYQGDVRFQHKGGGLSRLIKKAATGESLRLMEASGSGELFLASQAMLVHVLRLHDEGLSVNGANRRVSRLRSSVRTDRDGDIVSSRCRQNRRLSLARSVP